MARRWSPSDIDALRMYYHGGESVAAIAAYLGRSAQSVKIMAHRLELKRRQGAGDWKLMALKAMRQEGVGWSSIAKKMGYVSADRALKSFYRMKRRRNEQMDRRRDAVLEGGP